MKGTKDAHRPPKLRALLGNAGAPLIRCRFPPIPDLTALYARLVPGDRLAQWLILRIGRRGPT